MFIRCARSENEIADLENAAFEHLDQGSKFPGMSYEQGILATLEWLGGQTDAINPMDD